MEIFRRILLIDDDTISRYFTERVLIQMGVAKEIVSFMEGKEALEYIITNYSGMKMNEEHYADWILLELNHPTMDSNKFLQQLQALQYESLDCSSVTILTSSNYARDLNIITYYNVNGFLVKPITSTAIAEFINTCLN